MSENTMLPPIERDEEMGRTYIPLPGGYEVQTKGKGSTFRIAKTDGSDDRWPVMDNMLHEMLEDFARKNHAEFSELERQLAEVTKRAEQAEARIAESQRREPYGYIHRETGLFVNVNLHMLAPETQFPLYEHPIIQPIVEEAVRTERKAVLHVLRAAVLALARISESNPEYQSAYEEVDAAIRARSGK